MVQGVIDVGDIEMMRAMGMEEAEACVKEDTITEAMEVAMAEEVDDAKDVVGMVGVTVDLVIQMHCLQVHL